MLDFLRPSRQRSESRPIRRLALAGFVAVLCIGLITILIIEGLKERELTAAKQSLAMIDVALAEQAARSLQSVDLILSEITEQLRRERVTSPEEFVRLKAGRDTYQALASKITGVPQLDAIVLIAADGHLLNFSRYFPIPLIDDADRDYYAALRNSADDKPFLSVPVQNRGNGAWTIYLARRVSGPNGEFIGLVLGAINLGYFEELYHTLSLDGAGSGISLWRRDGILLARYPTLPRIGEHFQIKAFEDILLHGDAGVYETDKAIDGIARIVATRAASSYPIAVNVTRARFEVLTGWRRDAMIIGLVGILCSVVVLLLVIALDRQFRAYETVSHAMAERAEAISARNRVEDQLRQAQKLEAIGQLTSGVAHDFNNLLTSIIGNLELLQYRRGSLQSREAWIGGIRQAAERAVKLTRQLLAFSRKQRLMPRAVDVNEIVSGMEDLLASTLGGTVALKAELSPNLWPALIDRTQIELVILNLAINARDAMDGSGLLRITTRNVSIDTVGSPGAPSPGDYVAVSVIDIGAGMTADVLARAFDPFFTTKEPGNGSGLGLSQVYGVAHQSGGGVEIRSTLGEGTMVTIYLPRTVAEAAPVPIILPVQPSETAHDKVVLLVDDDTGVRSVTVSILKEFGYAVISASSGAEALALLADAPQVDLLLVDFAMPNMNGAEVATRARAMRPGIIVVFVTGYAEASQLVDEKWMILKPFRARDLSGKLALALNETAAPADAPLN